MKKETVTQKAARLFEETQILQDAVTALTDGTFQWGEWADMSIQIDAERSVQRDMRIGVGKVPGVKRPIILRQTRWGEDGRTGSKKQTETVALTVENLMSQSAFVLSKCQEAFQIAMHAKKVDGVWNYTTPQAVAG